MTDVAHPEVAALRSLGLRTTPNTGLRRLARFAAMQVLVAILGASEGWFAGMAAPSGGRRRGEGVFMCRR